MRGDRRVLTSLAASIELLVFFSEEVDRPYHGVSIGRLRPFNTHALTPLVLTEPFPAGLGGTTDNVKGTKGFTAAGHPCQ